MPIPSNWTTVPVRGRYLDSLGNPVVGRVTFTASPTRLTNAAELLSIVTRPISVTLDGVGRFTINLPATDDPDITPIDFTYQVREEFTGGNTYNIEVPSAFSTSGIDLATIAPVAAPNSGVLVVPTGPAGPKGDPGEGVPAGGSTGYSLVKLSGADYHTGWSLVTGGGGGGGITDHGLLSGLSDDDHTQYHTDTRGDARYYLKADVDSAIAANSTGDRNRSNHTGVQPSSTISDLTEAVQDIVGSFIVAGGGASVSYDDALATFTISATGTGGGGETDAEVVRDTIAAALVAGSGIQITVNDAGDTLTIASTAVLPTRTITAGTGLSGGGDLSANRTLSVAFGTTSTTVAAGDHNHTASALTGFSESVQDTVAAMLVEGNNVTLTYDDTANTLTVDATVATIAASAISSGTISIERLTPGSVIVVDYYKNVYGATNAWPASRPTARTDLVINWVGPSDPGAIAIAGDILDIDPA